MIEEEGTVLSDSPLKKESNIEYNENTIRKKRNLD